MGAVGDRPRAHARVRPERRAEILAERVGFRSEILARGLESPARIVAAVERVLAQSPPGDVAIVSHGAVGTLLQCALRGAPITRELDQPGQGHWFAFERASRRVLHGWRRLESHN